jgi:hypothetical protein
LHAKVAAAGIACVHVGGGDDDDGDDDGHCDIIVLSTPPAQLGWASWGCILASRRPSPHPPSMQHTNCT